MNEENMTQSDTQRSISDRPSVVRETQIMLTRLSLHSEKHAELSPLHVGGKREWTRTVCSISTRTIR